MTDLEAEQLRVFFLCSLAFLVIVPVHLAGLHAVAGIIHARRPKGDLHLRPLYVAGPFIFLVMLLFFVLHILTNMGWGLFMLGEGVFGSYVQCLFYSFENYTSLGLTRVDVDERWRMLAPAISLSGVFCLGWSTAVLASLFSHLYAAKSS